jgi:hypothetical protein
MLEKLQEIDWNALKAPEMPDWIRGLASTDTDIREAAYDSIYFDSGVMEYRSEVTPVIVPFIIELLQYDATPRKNALLMMLVVIAYEVYPIRHSLLAQRTMDEIGKGVDVYLSFLDEPETQRSALWLLTRTDAVGQSTTEVRRGWTAIPYSG